MRSLITPFRYEEGESYRFRLLEDVTIDIGPRLSGKHAWCDGSKEWAVVSKGAITIRKGYSWDGASPKFRLLGRWVGTPDFEGTRLAALVHDCLYQFMDLECMPIDRRDADWIFGSLMKEAGFPVAGIYFGAVAVFGGLWRLVSKPFSKKQDCFCVNHSTFN